MALGLKYSQCFVYPPCLWYYSGTSSNLAHCRCEPLILVSPWASPDRYANGGWQRHTSANATTNKRLSPEMRRGGGHAVGKLQSRATLSVRSQWLKERQQLGSQARAAGSCHINRAVKRLRDWWKARYWGDAVSTHHSARDERITKAKWSLLLISASVIIFRDSQSARSSWFIPLTKHLRKAYHSKLLFLKQNKGNSATLCTFEVCLL